MSIRFRPGGQIPVVLQADKNQPNPPTFYLRNISGAEAMDFADMFDAMRGAKGREAIVKAFDAIRNVLVGWKDLKDIDGAEVAFDLSLITHIFTLPQVGELIAACLKGNSLSDEQRGK